MAVGRMLLLAALLILGLLGMHALGGHAAEHPSMSGTAASSVTGHAVGDAAGHAVADAAMHGTAPNETTLEEANSGGHGAQAGIACVLALLVGLLLLIRPSGWRSPQPVEASEGRSAPASAPLAPPSLHVLCISRT